MKRPLAAASLSIAAFAASPSQASTPAAYAALDRQSSAACIKASGLRDARVGEAVRFSDSFLMDARTVSGVWPQAHMKGAKANMLCLYNRRTRRAETQEATANTHPASAAAEVQVKDVWWRAEDVGVGGGGVIDDARVTLQLGSDGKIGGKSGCNNYSANYMLTGSTLKIYPPMIGTRMMCPPALMALETKFQKLLLGATKVVVRPDGGLMLNGADGQSLRFVREP